MGLPDYLSRAPVVNNDMSEDGEQDNHKLDPEYLENLVRPSCKQPNVPCTNTSTTRSAMSKTTTTKEFSDATPRNKKLVLRLLKII